MEQDNEVPKGCGVVVASGTGCVLSVKIHWPRSRQPRKSPLRRRPLRVVFASCQTRAFTYGQKKIPGLVLSVHDSISKRQLNRGLPGWAQMTNRQAGC